MVLALKEAGSLAERAGMDKVEIIAALGVTETTGTGEFALDTAPETWPAGLYFVCDQFGVEWEYGRIERGEDGGLARRPILSATMPPGLATPFAAGVKSVSHVDAAGWLEQMIYAADAEENERHLAATRGLAAAAKELQAAL